MKTIIAAVDFSDVTQSVVDTAERMTRALGGQLVLFHMSPAAEPWVIYAVDGRAAGLPTIPHWEEEQEEERTKLLEHIRDSLVQRGLQATTYVTKGVQLEAICQEMEALDPDMIVLGSHRHGVLHDLLGQGVCTRVVRRARCPVLVVHPGDKHGPAKPADPIAPMTFRV